MFPNYLKVAFRNLIRNKSISFINISGLAIGMASAMLILLWIQNEISVDRFHENGDRLFEVWSLDQQKVDGEFKAYTPTPEVMAPFLKKDYPDLEEVTRVSWGDHLLFSYGERKLKTSGILVDTGFLNMFSFPLVLGDKHSALKDPYSVLITQKLARSLFGNENPMGKAIKVDNGDNFTVAGVLKDLPNNTQFRFDYLMSYELKTKHGWIDNDWTDFNPRTFAMLKKNTSASTVGEKIKNIIVKYSGGRAKTGIFLYPVSQLQLYSNFNDGKPNGGRIETVRVLAIIVAFILLIACINFVNLTTARSERRAKEVGIRKVAGALKSSLIRQFLIESILLSIIAGSIALVLVRLFLPSFNLLTQKELTLDYGQPIFLVRLIGFILFTGLLAGMYPAFYISAYRPVSVLKGEFRKIHALVTPRKVLVVTQFSFAFVLIIATILVKQQIDFGNQKSTGYDKSRMVYVPIEGDIWKNYALIKDGLLKSGIAESVSQSLSPLTDIWSAGHSLTWKGKKPNSDVMFIRSSTDGNLVKTAGLHLAEGRDIDLNNYPSDSTACLINEAAAKILGFRDPLGETIFDDPTTWHIVGVIKDFIIESPYEPIRPVIFKGPKSGRNVLNIRISSAHTQSQFLASAEKIFKQFNPAYPFDYHFMDDEYARKFSQEQLTGKLAAVFAALTIFISCLGMFGLATYMAETRIREIGIRKVLGASVANITAMLSVDFVKLVLTAILIGAPIAYWAMKDWLDKYNYHIQIGWGVFLIAGAAAIMIALISVGYQSIRAAVANPVKSLRAE
jgi:ABC-type antimicrobial peptide transport system permease subunit